MINNMRERVQSVEALTTFHRIMSQEFRLRPTWHVTRERDDNLSTPKDFSTHNDSPKLNYVQLPLKRLG
ncbi:hypothetical protein TNCT_234001 [Trichonephila clavata]|uniref:Uncharacterized protein n=1 Tax=Trichonephila clavata TaxID=2740835 RepID=A0A8X6LKZ6_TRICU|nr:hypothetical protein TNCT_528401 [Trichonephila clavata]GFR14589.1 hypothetical protein TNCT_527251 [Trichonephila clavata]GFR14591.1 hypothetical protein TNCT_527261 [Trichonephila clavata]GFR14869.1 hypothetical protein TNCT_234001 [Trichonephila clavata]